MTAYRDPWVKKAKWLTQALIISCTLNVGLLTTFLYFAMTENNGPLASNNKTSKPIKESLDLQSTLTKYAALSFQDLLIRLGNNDHVESGCTRRDLALSCLTEFHHFNLERALGGVTLQKREITYHAPTGEPIHLTVFPSLAEYQFQAILQYAKTEKWPLTSEGLFLKLQALRAPFDPSLLEAFSLTPEFHFIGLLFSKTGIQLKKEYLAALLSQGSWSILSETSDHLRQTSEFTAQERRHFLLRLLSENSKLAAKILVEIDQDYCLKNLDNEQVLTLCTLLSDKAPASFLRALIQSPRSDSIWQTAAAILYDQAAEDIPEELNLQDTKRRFIELKAAPPKPRLATQKTYKVKSGDSLWKIARDHNTTIKALLEANDLHSDRLNIGQTLTLP
ncbi:MAG: LysM peptidoglycan-binding domain-containing protein [Simkaniaceae bacterium]|nr:LysM peptidoglycan-binding domain-containing protein [Candidatus Sacchlamyda saccharinae]